MWGRSWQAPWLLWSLHQVVWTLGPVPPPVRATASGVCSPLCPPRHPPCPGWWESMRGPSVGIWWGWGAALRRLCCSARRGGGGSLWSPPAGWGAGGGLGGAGAPGLCFLLPLQPAVRPRTRLWFLCGLLSRIRFPDARHFPSSRPLFGGQGGVPWVWNLTWCLSKPAFLLGWVLATPMKEESRVPGWEAAAEQSHGGGGSTTPKSSPPPDVCMCSVCDLDGDPATPVCGHVSSRLALFW